MTTYNRDPSFTPAPRKRKRRSFCGCLVVLLVGLVLFPLVYLLYPADYTILVLGIDKAPGETAAGRSDTNILVGIGTLRSSVRGLSVPRDLWVPIPGYGENRINAAHYFGELEQAGNGPTLAIATFEQNFGVKIDYYLRIQLANFPQIIDALGGIEVELSEPMAGWPAGTHHMDGAQALAFVRSREYSDDFSRMKQSQVMILALVKAFSQPQTLLKLPAMIAAAGQVVDGNIPVWQLPRLTLAGLLASGRIEFKTIEREMTTPWVTDAGAQVLLPDWGQILPLVQQLFGS